MSGHRRYFGEEITIAARKAGFLLGNNLATGSVRIIFCEKHGPWCREDPDRFTYPGLPAGQHRHQEVRTWPYEAALAWLRSPAAEEWKLGGIQYTADDAAGYGLGGTIVPDLDEAVADAEAGGPW